MNTPRRTGHLYFIALVVLLMANFSHQMFASVKSGERAAGSVRFVRQHSLRSVLCATDAKSTGVKRLLSILNEEKEPDCRQETASAWVLTASLPRTIYFTSQIPQAHYTAYTLRIPTPLYLQFCQLLI